jgi:hypothetical protein
MIGRPMLSAKAMRESGDEFTVGAGIPEWPVDVQEHAYARPGFFGHPVSQRAKQGFGLVQLKAGDENAVPSISE